MSKPEIRKLLVLSTLHLTEDQRIELNQLWLREGNIGASELTGAVLYPTQYGGLLWVPDDPEESAKAAVDGVDENILAIQLYARKHECDYVLLDGDAEMVGELNQYQERDNLSYTRNAHSCVGGEGE